MKSQRIQAVDKSSILNINTITAVLKKLWYTKVLKNYEHPKGLIGMWVGWKMQLRTEQNAWTLQLLDIKPNDNLLEIGFGPGVGVEMALKLVPKGCVTGVDISKIMVLQARWRNAEAVARGHAKLYHGNIQCMGFEENSFDKIYGVHIFYFIRHISSLKILYKILTPGGRICLFMSCSTDAIKKGVTTYYQDNDRELLACTGFKNISTRTLHMKEHPGAVRDITGICLLAEK